MNPPVDLEQIVTGWLRDQASASGSDRVLAAALGRAATTRQERRRPPWLRLPLWPMPKVAMVATTMVVVVASLALLSVGSIIGPGTVVRPTPVPVSTPPACPRPVEPLAPGRYVITDLAPIRLTIAMPDSWVAGCVKAATDAGADPVWWAGAGRALGAIGFTVADPIPAECKGLPGWARSNITIGGFDGERFDYVGPFDKPFTNCHPNLLMDQLGDEGGRGPETLFTLWMLDVDGERLSMYAAIKALDYQRKAELRQLVESVEIESPGRPSPAVLPNQSPRPTEADYPSGLDIRPGDRQSLTVDGVPLSFIVPTEGWMPGIQLKKEDGTTTPRSLYIGKSIVRGQAAEAVVFWTAFPDGANTDSCAKLLGPDVGPSAADLAATISKAPGTDLVTGPSEVTLGGHPATHVALTIREDLGCDPGSFFTWPDECWGECWAFTAVGDTIDVWVLDVDGRRLVIESETRSPPDPDIKPEVQRLLESALVLEVQHIVESIRVD